MTVIDARPAPTDAPSALAPAGTPSVAPTGVASGWAPVASVRVVPWLGVLGLAGAAASLGAVGLHGLRSAGDLGAVVATAADQTAGPVVVAVVLLLFVAERRWPAVRRPALARAHLVDAVYFGVAATAVPVLVLVQVGFATEVDRHAGFVVLGRLPLAPQIVVVAAILAGIDAMNWAAHVANHRSAVLWRLHALHHSQEDMSVFTTFRTHPLIHVSYLPAMVPALVLGASGTVPDAALVAYGCLVVLPHANLRWTFGPLGRVVVSPAYHRLHHARRAVGPRGTVNFGFVLVCWDQLARRAAYPSSTAPPLPAPSTPGGHPAAGGSAGGPEAGAPVPTGLAGRPVPVEQDAPDRGLARVVLAQLGQPFRVRAAMDGRP